VKRPPTTPAASTMAVTVGGTFTPLPPPTAAAPDGPTTSTCLIGPSNITYNIYDTACIVYVEMAA